MRVNDAYFVVLNACYAVSRYGPPFFVRADPKLGVDLIFGNDFTGQNVAHKEVVVHSLGNDLGDRRGFKLDEGIVSRVTSLTYEIKNMGRDDR